MRGFVGLLLVVVLMTSGVTGLPTPAVATANETPTDSAARIVGIYPNPVLENDRGEFVVIDVSPGTDLGPLVLTDGETALDLPDRTVAGRIAIGTDPVTRNLTEDPVMVVDGRIRLSNAGERVWLEAGDREVNAVTYPQAPEGSIYDRTSAGWTWRPLGATAFPVRSTGADAAQVFVLPDAPDASLAPLRSTDRRLWLAAYTITSGRVVDTLCAARDRSVDVRLLVERDPVGGMAESQAQLLDRLLGCDVPVRVIGGKRARYRFHHAKYAIADDRAVVLTENWKQSGVGGRSSRGWGVVLVGDDVTAMLAATFEADASWRDARPWDEVRSTTGTERTESPANGSYESIFTPTTVRNVAVDVIVAPDNAEGRVVGLLDGAQTSIRVIQVSVDGPGHPFVRALVRAARRGVSVQLLLADVWYVREHNRAVAAALDAIARDEGLPLEVRLAAPQGRYGKIHAKGAVVDDERVLLGSLNWNNVSARQNREVAVVIHDEQVGAYFARVFRADWQGGRWRLPGGLLAVVAGLTAVATGFARRTIEFEAADAEGVVTDAASGRDGGPW